METIQQRDKRIQDVALLERGGRMKKALASAIGEEPRAPFADVQATALSQGHPGRIAMGATTAEQHSVASSYHGKRSSELEASGKSDGAATAHGKAALLHDRAMHSGDADDSTKARGASQKALSAEYGDTGGIGMCSAETVATCGDVAGHEFHGNQYTGGGGGGADKENIAKAAKAAGERAYDYKYTETQDHHESMKAQRAAENKYLEKSGGEMSSSAKLALSDAKSQQRAADATAKAYSMSMHALVSGGQTDKAPGGQTAKNPADRPAREQAKKDHAAAEEAHKDAQKAHEQAAAGERHAAAEALRGDDVAAYNAHAKAVGEHVDKARDHEMQASRHHLAAGT